MSEYECAVCETGVSVSMTTDRCLCIFGVLVSGVEYCLYSKLLSIKGPMQPI